MLQAARVARYLKSLLRLEGISSGNSVPHKSVNIRGLSSPIANGETRGEHEQNPLVNITGEDHAARSRSEKHHAD